MARSDFETMVTPLLEKAMEPVRQLAMEAQVNKFTGFFLEFSQDVDVIELIGGGTRMPMIRDKIGEILGKPTSRTLPAETTAIGCALQAAILR
jgi:heat shock protein 4